MTETADLLHHVRGRLRLHVPSGKGDPARLETIRKSLAGLTGVTSVNTNPLLGTIVVQYDPNLFAEFQGALSKFAEDQGLFTFSCRETESGPCVSKTERSITDTLTRLNRSVQQATGNIINLKELLPIGLAVYGLLFVNKAAAAAQWLNWLQFAFDSYIDLHEDQPITELGDKLEAMGARILERHSVTAEALSIELSALREELRRLADRLPPPAAT